MATFVTTRKLQFLVMSLMLALEATEVFARAGGGGSGGGGGGGGHGGGGSLLAFLIKLIIFLIIFTVAAYQRQKKIKKAEAEIQQAEAHDSTWEEGSLKARVQDVFYRFQKDWTEQNPAPMKDYLVPAFYEKMVLEMSVLYALHRKNIVNNLTIPSIVFLDADDETDNAKDSFVAEVAARAHDVLIDTATNQELFVDDSVFVEYWKFLRVGSDWKLYSIAQSTEETQTKETPIMEFAHKNNFQYDPDFGWLMLPNKGVIFTAGSFGGSDINNHVVGVYRGKIVEFYTYIPNAQRRSTTNYIVAQAILPIQFIDILVKKKNRFFNFTPKGLIRLKSESIDFNNKFCLWAASGDQVSSFELLTPNFMEKIYNLPFNLNIEIVGPVLYFYSTTRKNLQYDTLLEVLSWAFDEMKM